jgi:hypothetical protein
MWVERLCKFQRPVTLLEIVRESATVPDDRFFNDPEFKPLHEAWAAGYFALGLERTYGHLDVRLDSERFPDFHLRLKGQEYAFEFTSVDKPGRRRGREYKDRRTNPLLPTPYQPGRGRQEGPSWVAAAIRKKHAKRYSTRPHLLVYANFEADALDPAVLANQCGSWSASFSSIWVLWRYQYSQLHDSEAFGKAHLGWRPIGVNPWA